MVKNTPIVNQAGLSFLGKLKETDPQLFRAVMDRMPQSMAGMGGLWDDISTAIGGVIKDAPSLIRSELDAKRRLAAAENAAQYELDKAASVIRQQEIEANLIRDRAQLANTQQMLQIERANLEAAKSAMLSAGQKVGLGAAAALTLLLVVLITKRKKGAR
jgi:hypothetical protein